MEEHKTQTLEKAVDTLKRAKKQGYKIEAVVPAEVEIELNGKKLTLNKMNQYVKKMLSEKYGSYQAFEERIIDEKTSEEAHCELGYFLLKRNDREKFEGMDEFLEYITDENKHILIAAINRTRGIAITSPLTHTEKEDMNKEKKTK